MRRTLIILGVAAAGFVAILPFSSEANPDYERAQAFLDEMADATSALQNGSATTSDFDLDRDGFEAHQGPVGDATATVLVGPFDVRCFVIHWQVPGNAGARAGTLDPRFPCAATDELLATMPDPPLVESFAGTVPPIDASQLVSRVGAPRHGSFDPFVPNRTPGWFIVAASVLATIVLWQLVTLTLIALRRGESLR